LISETDGKTLLKVPGHPELETEDNLVVRAVRWLERETGSALPCSIVLTKRIPIAAGLGGGSSNAAGALLGVGALFDLDLSDESLQRGARALGADVPYFLVGGTAVGEGIGDELTRVSVPSDYGLILVNPGLSVSTRTIYAEFDRTLTRDKAHASLWQMLRKGAKAEDLLCNDLQPVVEALHPEIAEIRNGVLAAGARKVAMTGSGPTVFGIADSDPRQLREICDRLPIRWNRAVCMPSSHGVLID
jgi:4-diphosphocytidyl-2-C-methyl-D-erythritol kinase